MTDRTGECLCGAVRFTVTGGRDDFGVCHCKMCQRWSGGLFPGIMYGADQVAIAGRENVTDYPSSPGCLRSFCRICGSTLWFVDDRHPGKIEVALGVLDDTEGLVLTHEIFTDRRPPALTLAGDHVRDTEAEYRAKVAAARGEAG